MDCVDTDASVYAGAADAWYDGVDADCAGNDDFDQDVDGYDSTADCDDTRSAVNPAAVEDCANSYDDDCDSDTNDAGAIGCIQWYEDADGDGYGAAEACLCAATATYTISTGDDCDDSDATVSPAETEVCNNGVDDDCDGGGGTCELTGGSLSGADAIWTGEAMSDAAGEGVDGAGDFNCDGYDDVVVGAPGNSGNIYVVFGTAAPASGSLGGGSVEFAGSGGRPGYAVAGVGDVDLDGCDDILVGWTGYTDAGAAALVLGSAAPSAALLGTADAIYQGYTPSASAGASVAAGGDLDGDGFPDLLVGSPGVSDAASAAGAAFVVFGSASPSTTSLYWSPVHLLGSAASDNAGSSVAGLGDVDGDGLADIAVGAPGNDDAGSYAGAAYLLLGSVSIGTTSLSSADAQYTGEAAGDEAGDAVAAAGDVDGDGLSDMLVASPNNDNAGAGAGAVYLVLGSTVPTSSGLATAVEFTGEAPGDFAGGTCDGVGDLDGDGNEDILIGAPNSDATATGVGAAYVVWGSSVPAPMALSAAVRLGGESGDDHAGTSVAGAGDVNADGRPDLVVGAPGSASAASDAGAAYLILGQGL